MSYLDKLLDIYGVISFVEKNTLNDHPDKQVLLDQLQQAMVLIERCIQAGVGPLPKKDVKQLISELEHYSNVLKNDISNAHAIVAGKDSYLLKNKIKIANH